MGDEPGIFEVMYTCRAMRRLKPEPVPEELLLKLVDAGHQGPTGSNLQRDRWIIIRDRAQVAAIGELNLKVMRDYIAPGSGRPDELPHQDAERRGRMLDAVVWQGEHYAEIPALIIPCREFDTPPAGGDWISGAQSGGSIWPGVQNVLLAARALGLGAALTTFPLEEREAFKAILGLPDNVEPYCVLPVGYPMGNFGPVSRSPLESVVRWDRW